MVFQWSFLTKLKELFLIHILRKTFLFAKLLNWKLSKQAELPMDVRIDDTTMVIIPLQK